MVLPDGSGLPKQDDSISDITASVAPHSMLPGRTVRCDEVPESHLAACGATIPTKPIGPQKAVTAPVMRQQLDIASSLILLEGAPDIRA